MILGQRMRKCFWLFILAVVLGLKAAPCQAERVTSDGLMKGTRYETRYYTKVGDAPGPTVVVVGGVHGDEPAGYLAARKLVKWKITKGTLVVLPDAHREAIRRNTRGYPGNMNRMFPGKAKGDAMQRLAYEIFQIISAARPDLLLTLHESRDFHADNPARYGQTFCFDFAELVPYMKRVMERANADISPRKHKFLIFVDPFPTCPTYQSWVKLRVPATSIETSKTLPLRRRITYQLMATQAFFDDVGLGYEQSDVPRLSTAAQPAQGPLISRSSITPVRQEEASAAATLHSDAPATPRAALRATRNAAQERPGAKAVSRDRAPNLFPRAGGALAALALSAWFIIRTINNRRRRR